MQRFGMILERFISPEGAFPVFGRSITYRTGTLQPLALLAWRGWLPKELSNGQVRAAMTAVINRMFGDNRNFNEKGFLTLGFNGSQPHFRWHSVHRVLPVSFPKRIWWKWGKDTARLPSTLPYSVIIRW